MLTVIAEILPLALVVTISPLNVIPAILLLFTKKPLLNASLFAGAFMVGVAAVLVLVGAISQSVESSSTGTSPTWVSAVKIILGLYLVVAAVKKFRGRPRDHASAALPKWMEGVANFTPTRSLETGLALGGANPKNLVVGIAAGLTLAIANLSVGASAVVIVTYVVVASAGVITPIVTMVALGDRAPAVLEGWKQWLGDHNAAIMAVLFLVFGVVLFSQGLAEI